jgi:hypothetical protein
VSLFDLFKKPDSGAEARKADILNALRGNSVIGSTKERLESACNGRLPWMATLTPAELLISRSHGLRPIATVSATCWLHYGWSWTEGHAQGWEMAVWRLREEARAAGANAVLDVKMRTIPLAVENSMDFTLVGTAVKVDGLPPSVSPIIATIPALEFVKLLEADIVPTGIAIGAEYQWLDGWQSWGMGGTNMAWMGNIECVALSNLLNEVRRSSHAGLRASAKRQGNGVLAHINFSQVFEVEQGERQPKKYLARHIVVATTVDARPGPGAALPLEFQMVVDMHASRTPLTGAKRHHQSYASNDREGAI